VKIGDERIPGGGDFVKNIGRSGRERKALVKDTAFRQKH